MRNATVSSERYDVVVIGGGSAGVAAAVAAARNGARTALVDAAPMVGGELISGLPINACLNARGEWVVGGVIRELIDECAALGGLIGPYFDWRSLWLVCVDPEKMKIAVARLLGRAGVELMLETFADDVVAETGQLHGISVVGKRGRRVLFGEQFIDCSGDGDISVLAGAPSEFGSPEGHLQPVTVIFRMSNVDAEPLLDFVRKHPDYAGLGECLIEPRSREDCAEALYRQGIPSVFFDGKGPFISEAIAQGELRPCGILAVCPLSEPRREVSLNTTRIADLDATNPEKLSRALPDLLDQVWTCVRFLKSRVPGFENAHFSGLAPRIGIRETRRVVGEEVLQRGDVLSGRKRDDGICKGAHELDVHGAGSAHRREMIKDGGSYDVPFGCLLPKRTSNLLVAGRCLSATREAHGSARVMGTCMGMGQAAGTAAAMCATEGTSLRQLSISVLRDRLEAQGAVLQGTH
jgi:hypothetical protein